MDYGALVEQTRAQRQRFEAILHKEFEEIDQVLLDLMGVLNRGLSTATA